MPGFKNSPINKAVDSFKYDFKSGGNWLYTPNNGDELKARRDFILGASNLITPFFPDLKFLLNPIKNIKNLFEAISKIGNMY